MFILHSVILLNVVLLSKAGRVINCKIVGIGAICFKSSEISYIFIGCRILSMLSFPYSFISSSFECCLLMFYSIPFLNGQIKDFPFLVQGWLFSVSQL